MDILKIKQEQMRKITSWKYRVVNLIGDKFAEKIFLSESELLERASRIAGLSDWGDESFRAPLKVLLSSYEKDAHLNFYGRLRAQRDVIRALVNRLKIQADITNHPEILDTPIPRMLVITGLQRTGTTFLHGLLAQDPNNRTLKMWELLSPSPPPSRDTYESDPRRLSLKKWQSFWEWFVLSKRGKGIIKAIHEDRYNSPGECRHLMKNSFLFHIFIDLCTLNGYIRWLNEQDMYPSYRYYRLQIQLLLWRCTGDWLVVKGPNHLRYLDVFKTVFPDAHIIWIHRDPLKVLPSMCSLANRVHQMNSDAFLELEEFGSIALDFAAAHVEKGMKAWDSIADKKFHNVDYYALVKDPIGTVKRIYEDVGAVLSDEAERRMKDWLRLNKKDKHGVHHYHPEVFGLDTDKVNERFRAYRERFSIPFE